MDYKILPPDQQLPVERVKEIMDGPFAAVIRYEHLYFIIGEEDEAIRDRDRTDKDRLWASVLDMRSRQSISITEAADIVSDYLKSTALVLSGALSAADTLRFLENGGNKWTPAFIALRCNPMIAPKDRDSGSYPGYSNRNKKWDGIIYEYTIGKKLMEFLK